MKLCSTCGSYYLSLSRTCVVCGTSPYTKDGFCSYVPEAAGANDGFKAGFYGEYVDLESNHFWFRARSQLIIWALRKYCADLLSFFEVGCGTGYVLHKIAGAFPSAKLHGSEIFTTALRHAATRLPTVEFMQMDAREIPFIGEFDAIGAFDVLEHIEQDGRVLAQMHNALKKDGVMLLTVPQHAWLWSPVDDYSRHVRRYSVNGLHTKIKTAGFEILRSTSFVSLLLPVMMLSRMAKRKPTDQFDTKAELKLPWILNKLFYLLMLIEAFFIKWGWDLPVGGSRLVIARKAEICKLGGPE